jgi:hypothetical protein
MNPCARCAYARGASCNLSRPRTEATIHWIVWGRYNYGDDLAAPRPVGMAWCPDAAPRVKTEPAATPAMVVMFDGPHQDRVAKLIPVREAYGDSMYTSWVIPKPPFPPIGAHATFDQDTRQKSKEATIKWRQPVHRYGTTKLGNSRTVVAVFGDTDRYIPPRSSLFY